MSKILIIDDEPVAAQVLNRLLTSAGHAVKVAHSGFDAWMMLTGFCDGFDIVFLDLGLPDMNGLELLLRIRKLAALKSIRIIVCTAANDRKSVVKASALGIRQYIVKPVEPATVLAKLADAVATWTPGT